MLEFNLSENLTYTSNGNPNCKTATLFLKAPTMKNLKFTSKLEQLIMKSMMSATKHMSGLTEIFQQFKKDQEEIKEEEIEVTLEEKITQIELYIKTGDIDFMDYIECFSNFLLQKNCFLDEDSKVSLTPSLLDEICVKDIKRMIYEYIANFTMPSL